MDSSSPPRPERERVGVRVEGPLTAFLYDEEKCIRMVGAVFLHMARVFFTGAYRGTRALNWSDWQL